MLAYLRSRLVALLPTALVPIVFIFFLVRLAPGDPARNILGDYATEEDVARLRQELGLDRHVLVQFIDFLKNLARGDLGTSDARPRRCTRRSGAMATRAATRD